MSASAHDFDFIFGQWTVQNRKLTDVTDPACTTWVEFDAISDVSPVLGGAGHVDRMSVDAPTDGGEPFEGFTLRLFDPQTSMWRIWWSSTRAPGVLDAPLEGRFTDGQGRFEAVDRVGGRAVRVRFEWSVREAGPHWQQSFSYDDGRTWGLNWTMDFVRCHPC